MDHFDVEKQGRAMDPLHTPNNSHGSSPASLLGASNTQSPNTPNAAAATISEDKAPPAATISEDISNNGSAAPSKYKACVIRCVRPYGYVLLYTCIIISFIVVFPFLLVQSILSLCFIGKIDFIDELSLKFKKPRSTDGIYEKIFESKPRNIKLKHLNKVAVVRLGLLSLLWLVVNLCVPSFRRKTLFGSLLWKWSLLAVVVLLGHFTAIFTICVPFEVLTNAGVLQGKSRSEYFIQGLQYDGSLLFYSVMILCAWQFYFQTEHGLNPNPKPGGIDMYCTRALWCCVVGTALWVLKSAVLSQWKAKAILERFKDRIITAGFHFFFLICIIVGLDEEEGEDGGNEPFRLPWGCEIPNKKENVALLQIEEMARALIIFAAETPKDDTATADILKKFQRRFPSDNEGGPYISEDWLVDKFKLLNHDALLLIKEVRAKNPFDEKMTYATFCEWMENAHKGCFLLGHTLSDAFPMVRDLDVVLKCCIIVAVILFWLLATGLAATNVLVTIGSIFVGLSFMFADTCKAFFQGVIFCFLSHPVDFADRCIVDEIEVEVRRIGIMTTTCIKIKTGEIMLYPNSVLSTKIITKLKDSKPDGTDLVELVSKPDGTDLVELVLDSSTKSDQIISLQCRIELFFDGPDAQHFFDRYHKVLVKEMGNSIKMSIEFKHILTNAVDYNTCFEVKERQRHEFLIWMKKLLEELNINLSEMQ